MINLHIGDLPSGVKLHGDLAIDTEAMGLQIKRDRLCLVQICDERDNIHLVHFPKPKKSKNAPELFNGIDTSIYNAPNLREYLLDSDRQKIFHYARFDVAILQHYLQIDEIPNIFCTKIASKLARTYTDYHGLRNVVNELLNVELKKEQQSSNWGASVLTEAQKHYAKNDVIHLHALRDKLIEMLEASERYDLAQKYFDFIPTLCNADLMGFSGDGLFTHGFVRQS